MADQGEPIRVVIADDHPAYGEGLSMLLSSVAEDVAVVGTARDAATAIQMVEQQIPDIVLMDINMPGTDGIAATRKIREEFPVVKVVMLTVSEDDRDVYEAMKAGASGYLPKQVEVDELVAAVRAVDRGQVVVSPLVAGKLLAGEKDEIPLTEAERQMLRLVAEGHDNAHIAEEMSISESTVKRTLRNVVEKLHLQNRVQAAVYAAKKGWV